MTVTFCRGLAQACPELRRSDRDMARKDPAFAGVTLLDESIIAPTS